MVEPLEVLSTKSCAPCKTLQKFLDYKGIPYSVTYIDDNDDLQKKVVAMTGRYIVPATRIGTKWISGYRPADIMEAIDETNF